MTFSHLLIKLHLLHLVHRASIIIVLGLNLFLARKPSHVAKTLVQYTQVF